MARISTVVFLGFILIAYQIRNDIGLSNIYKEAISDYYGSVKFGEGTIAFSKVLNFVLSVDRIELDVKLPSLMIISSSHHGVHWRLFFARVGVIRITCRNYEVIHFLFQNLFTGCRIFNKSARGSRSIFGADIIVIILGSIFNPKISVTIKLLPSWAIFISYHILILLGFIIILLVRNYSQRIHEQSEILFEMGRAQNFQLQDWNISLLDQFLKQCLSSFLAIVN